MKVWKVLLTSLTSGKNWRRSLYFFCTCSVFVNHVGGFVFCKGISMLPYIEDGDIAFAERFSVVRNNLHRDDIVCLKSPTDFKTILCKRMVLKEHDKIVIGDEKPRRIRPGHCYVLGDNKDVSIDSRHFGPVSMGLIQDRVVLRIWPLSRFGWISNHYFWEPEFSSY